MGIPEASPAPRDPNREKRAPAPRGGASQESNGRPRTTQITLRERIEKWVDAVGYWGEASKVLVGESIATDYSPPLTTGTFGLGALSFHCVQNDETGDFRVSLKGSKIRHIPDLATLHRAIQESDSRTGSA